MISMVIGVIVMFISTGMSIIETIAIGLVLIALLFLHLMKIWWNPVEPPDNGGKKSLKVVKDNNPTTPFFYWKNKEKQYNYSSWSSASLRGVVLMVRKTRSYHRSVSFVLRVWMRDCWSRKSFNARSWSDKMTDKVDHLRYHCSTWSVPSKDHNSFNNSLAIMTRS